MPAGLKAFYKTPTPQIYAASLRSRGLKEDMVLHNFWSIVTTFSHNFVIEGLVSDGPVLTLAQRLSLNGIYMKTYQSFRRRKIFFTVVEQGGGAKS